MEILDSRTVERRRTVRRGFPERPVGRAAAAAPAIAGIIAAALVIGWEIARPTLPAPFELAAAARSPGSASWMGRLPMAALAVAGSIALYTLLARTTERRAGAYAVAILATTPAWFVHARTMTGAMVPMACSVIIFAGLGAATLAPPACARWTQLGGGAVAFAAALASVLAPHWGAPARGLLAVAGVPALAVGAAALLWSHALDTKHAVRASTNPAALVVLAIGVLLASASALVAIAGLRDAWAVFLLGARATSVAAAGAPPTFEAPVAVLAYGLVPWTPLVPFALARRPTSAGHLAILIGAILAVAVHAALAPRSGPSTLVGIAAVAGAIALMLRSLEETRRPATALVMSVLALGWLVAHDVKIAPERVLVAFGATDTAMPAAHAAASSLAIRSSVWLCMVLTAVALLVPRTWLPTGRGLAIVAGGVFAGLALRAHAYPELLSRLSPGAAFDAWASRHRAGERSVSPLDAIVLAAPPGGLRPLDAVLEDRLDALGWQLVDDGGHAIDAVPRGSRSAHVRVFVRSRGTGMSAYCTFLHVDHSPARFSAEHRELAYPMGLWRAGDVVVDDFDVKLPAHFRAGGYRMYWGVAVLPCEDDRRMHVTSGPNDGRGRIPAGTLEVR